MRAPAVALTALLLLAPLALAEEQEPALPRLVDVGEVRIDMPEGGTNMTAALSPDGRHVAVVFAPRSDDSRRSDSWTALRVIDVAKATVKGSWDGLDMGRLPPAFSPDGRLLAFGSRKDATTLTVHVRACASGRGVTSDVSHESGSQGFAEVCGVSGNARRVAVREPADADGRRHLAVFEHEQDRRIARFTDFSEPYVGGGAGRVALTGPLIAFHTWPVEEASGGHARLRVVELDTSRTVAETTGFASRTTPRYALTPDLGTLVNGTGGFAVEAIDLASGERRVVIDASDLTSHFLEVVLSGDGKRVVAWSDERKLILARDLDGGDVRRVETEFRAHVLGVGHDGRWAYVRVHDRGLVAVDLDDGRVAGTVARQLADWARITPDGRHLVTGERDDGGWTFTVRALKTP